MTTVLDIKQAVGAMTGDIQYVLFFQTDIVRYLNWGMRELCRDLKITQNVINGTPGTLSNFDVIGGIILPDNFSTENAVYLGSTGSLARATRIPQNVFWQDAIGSGSEQPSGYTVSDYLPAPNVTARHLLPYPHMSPGASLYYRIEYQGTPATVTADTDVLQVPSIMEELLVLYIVQRCKMQENDFETAASFKQELRERKMAVLADFAEHSDYEFYTIQDGGVTVGSVWE